MFSALTIANFKAFGPAQEIPLRPITLVFGPNSAGKSSIIQSLLLARHIRDTGKPDAHQTTLGGAAVDLGGFARYIHGHHADRETTIRLTFKRADIRGKFEEFGNLKTLSVEYTIGKSPTGGTASPTTVIITSATIFLDEQARFRLIRNEDGSLRVDVDAMRKRLEEKRSELEADLDFGNFIIAHRLAIIAEMADARFGIQNLTLNALNPLPGRAFYNTDDSAPEEHDAESNPRQFFAHVSKIDEDELHYEAAMSRWYDMDRLSHEERAAAHHPKETPQSEAKAFRFHFQLMIAAASEAVSAALAHVSYLGPLRWIPPRLISDGDQFDASWTAGGGDAWQRLRREPELLEQVNHFLQDTLQTHYRLRCNKLAPELDSAAIERCVKRVLESNSAASAGNSTGDPESARVAEDSPASVRTESSATALASALHAELRAQNSGKTLAELAIVNAESGLTVSHRDVGTGISQLLPVLVNAAGAKNQLIAIEQPELHLHPALQAELGDVFIESALGENKNTFLIETHSEHLILRLLRRVREAAEGVVGARPLRPEDICVLFVQPGKEGSEVLHLPVTPNGDFDQPWPGGFFAERAAELF